MTITREKIEEIRARYADQSWPNYGYFVHGQARMDIRDLLEFIDQKQTPQELKP